MIVLNMVAKDSLAYDLVGSLGILSIKINNRENKT